MTRKRAIPNRPSGTHTSEVAAIAGELVGAVVGSAAGPAGAVVGMVAGAMAGALAGHVLEDDARRAGAHDAQVDDAIGVTAGDLGAALPNAPPARFGAPSAASCGVESGGASASPAEGPIQDVDDDA